MHHPECCDEFAEVLASKLFQCQRQSSGEQQRKAIRCLESEWLVHRWRDWEMGETFRWNLENPFFFDDEFWATPLKNNMEPKKWRFGRWFSFSTGWFSGSMLVFGGVSEFFPIWAIIFFEMLTCTNNFHVSPLSVEAYWSVCWQPFCLCVRWRFCYLWHLKLKVFHSGQVDRGDRYRWESQEPLEALCLACLFQPVLIKQSLVVSELKTWNCIAILE